MNLCVTRMYPVRYRREVKEADRNIEASEVGVLDAGYAPRTLYLHDGVVNRFAPMRGRAIFLTISTSRCE